MAQYVISVAVVVVCTAISIPLRSVFEPSTFAMLYLLGVIGVSMRYQRRAAVLNALLSVTAFHYFCVPFSRQLCLRGFQLPHYPGRNADRRSRHQHIDVQSSRAGSRSDQSGNRDSGRANAKL